MAEEPARGKRKRLGRRIALAAAIGGALSLLTLAGASVCVKLSAWGRTWDSPETIPHRRVGLLLGCPRIVTHRRPNLFFQYRIEAAVELFQAGKVDYLLVSGDNLSDGCTEAADMRSALIRAGVPAAKIYCDFAGLRTLDSVVRAREVFGQTELTVISQKFHNERAIFLARSRGLHAIGFDAQMPGGLFGFLALCREQFARVRAVLDAYLLDTPPEYLDGKVRIAPDG